MSTSLRVTRQRLEERLAELEVAVGALVRQVAADAQDAERTRAAVQAVGSALALHVADDARHTGRPA